MFLPPDGGIFLLLCLPFGYVCQILGKECCLAGMTVGYLVCNAVGVPGNIYKFSIAHKLACRRGTAVPAFPPPDSPLFLLLIAHKLFWSFFLITAPALNRLHRFRSRLTARLPAARAEFLQRVRRLLTGGSLCPACALGGNRLARLFQYEPCCNFFFYHVCLGFLIQ